MNKKIVEFAPVMLFTSSACSQQGFTTEEDFTYRVINSGTAVEITGYTGASTNVRIPPQIQNLPVTVIGDGAFTEGEWIISDNERWFEPVLAPSCQLTNITIPNSVTRIGDLAFALNRLTSITIPDRVMHIGDMAFAGNHLTNVTIPNSVTEIGAGAFGSNQLTSVIIPERVTHIGDAAFSFNLLISVTIPDRVTHIGEWAFRNNQLTNITIPDSVTHIGEDAFADNQLIRVSIPSEADFVQNRRTPWGTPLDSFDEWVQIIRR